MQYTDIVILYSKKSDAMLEYIFASIWVQKRGCLRNLIVRHPPVVRDLRFCDMITFHKIHNISEERKLKVK